MNGAYPGSVFQVNKQAKGELLHSFYRMAVALPNLSEYFQKLEGLLKWWLIRLFYTSVSLLLSRTQGYCLIGGSLFYNVVLISAV